MINETPAPKAERGEHLDYIISNIFEHRCMFKINLKVPKKLVIAVDDMLLSHVSLIGLLFSLIVAMVGTSHLANDADIWLFHSKQELHSQLVAFLERTQCSLIDGSSFKNSDRHRLESAYFSRY